MIHFINILCFGRFYLLEWWWIPEFAADTSMTSRWWQPLEDELNRNNKLEGYPSGFT